jgi:hypothetical protein
MDVRTTASMSVFRAADPITDPGQGHFREAGRDPASRSRIAPIAVGSQAAVP